MQTMQYARSQTASTTPQDLVSAFVCQIDAIFTILFLGQLKTGRGDVGRTL